MAIRLSSLLLMLFAIATTAIAQIITINGTVNSMTFASPDVKVGDTVVATIDLTAPLINLTPSPQIAPFDAIFHKPFEMTAGDLTLSLPSAVTETSIGWLGFWGLDAYANLSTNNNEFAIELESLHPVLSSLYNFPADIPMSEFALAYGYWILAPGDRIDWTITGYSVSAASPSPVPEPSTYAISAVGILGILVAKRRGRFGGKRI